MISHLAALSARLRRRRGGFLGSVLVLSGGSIIGQVIVLACAPLIARLYGPGDLGVLGTFSSSLALLMVVASLRYEAAIPAASDDAEAANLLALAVLVAVVTSTTIGIALVLAGESLFPTLVRALPGAQRLMLPAGMLASAVYLAFSTWMIRKGQFKVLGQTRVTQSVTMVAAQGLLGFLRQGPLGLLVGQVLGSCGGLFRLQRRFVQDGGHLLARVNGASIRIAARRYQRFPKLSGPAVLLDAAVGNAPLLFIASVAGLEVAGQLTLVQRWLFVPITLLSGNLAQVIISELGLAKRTDPSALRGLFLRRLRQICLGTLVLVPCLALVVPPLVTWLFGIRWQMAGRYFVLLSPLVASNLVSAPFGGALDVMERQDLHLAREVARASVIGIALFAAWSTHASAEYVLALVSAAGVVNAVVYLYASWRSVRHPIGLADGSELALAEALHSEISL